MRHSTRATGIFTVVVLLGFALVGCPPEGNGVSVPNVVGMTQAAAEAAITAKGLVVGDVTETYSATVPDGQVISQDPGAGTNVDPGASVDLVVSKGPAPVNVPGVEGLSQSAAQVTITSAGLIVGDVTEAYSDTVADGYVISQNPASGTTVDEGTAVDLVISKGPAPIYVPNVVGMTQAAAEAAIIADGLAVGDVTQSESLTVPAGNVISQDPVAGTEASAGDPVDIEVSTGPPTVTVPDVLRHTEARAQDDLTYAGLTTGAITRVCSDVIAAGYVISQNPAADEEAPAGSGVDLTMSNGLCTIEQVPIAMVEVAGGTFTMGDDSPGRPIHSVTLSPYLIGKFEVTNMEYCAMLNWALDEGYLENSSGGPYTSGDPRVNGKILTDIGGTGNRVLFQGGAFVVQETYGFTRELHPMTCVTWYGGVAFCNWLSDRQGYDAAYDLESWKLFDAEPGDDPIQFTNGYRLPTEAEWEFAAAWDDGTHWDYATRSNTLAASQANYGRNNPLGIRGYPYTTIVGYYDGVNPGTLDSPGGAGCYDMSGNAAEWVYDWLSNYPDYAVTNPTGPDGPETYRINRGGYWDQGAASLNTSDRTGRYGSQEGTDIGFRIVRTSAE